MGSFYDTENDMYMISNYFLKNCETVGHKLPSNFIAPTLIIFLKTLSRLNALTINGTFSCMRLRWLGKFLRLHARVVASVGSSCAKLLFIWSARKASDYHLTEPDATPDHQRVRMLWKKQ